MGRVYSMLLEAAIAAVILLPLFYILDKQYFRNKKRSFLYFLLAVYFAAMDSVVGLPDIQYIQLDLNINLIPFQYMLSDYKNSLLNVLLFFPLGVFLPVLWSKFQKIHWTVLFGFCLSLSIELLQLFTFRATDVNDLMTNTVGTLAGWCAARIALRLLPGIQPQEKTKELYMVCGLTFGVMFLLQPFLANIVWNILY